MIRSEITIGPCRLILGECQDVFPDIGSVDVVITDPPFGETTHAGARTRTSGANSEELVKFASLTGNEAVDLFRSLCDLSLRWVIATVDWRHAAAMNEAGLPLVRLGVWIKPNSAPQLTGDRPATGWEAVAILHRAGKKRWNGGGSRAVWTVNRVNAVFHPTEKPVVLIERFVSLFSEQGETVLDPFMGSGTTGVACIQAGRNFIGIEKDPEFFQVAVDRIRRAWDVKKSELPFEIDPPSTEEQGTFWEQEE